MPTERTPPQLAIYATKPQGPVGRRLVELGLEVLPVEGDEEEVDRYVISARVAVERRTGATFLKGILDKSLFASAIFLREHFEAAVLVVEGSVDYTYRRFGPQAVRGALTAMVLEYGLSVLATPDAEETAALVAMLARQELVGIPEISLVPKRKAADLPDLQRRVVEMLPGCGRVAARELLRYFGGIEAVVAASPQELAKVPGIGRKRAAEIHQVLHAAYESLDIEKDLEEALARAPELLFGRPLTLLARQHGFAAEGVRHIVDLVFHDAARDEVVVVEVKRGALTEEHYRQVRRYLDAAEASPLLRRFGRRRGVLVTAETGAWEPEDPEVTVVRVKAEEALSVLRGGR